MATISTVTARQALKIQREPHWEKQSDGNYLGFRKMTASSSQWLARSRDTESGKQRYKSLADLSHLPPNEQWKTAKAEALAWFNHLGQGGSVKPITVLEACARYVDHLAGQGNDVAAKDYQRRYADYVASHKKFAATPVQELTKQQVQAWRKAHAASPCKTGARIGQPRSASALNREMATVKAALNLALEDGYATTDVAWKFTLRAVKDATGSRDVYLDRAQRDALLQQADASIKPFLQAACLLPLRPGALAQLTAGDFAKNIGTLKVLDKTGRRTIGLPPTTAAFIAEQCKNKLPAAPIFTDTTGKAWNKDSWKHPLKSAALAAGLPTETTMYALRHSTITDMVQGGIDLATVSQLAGTSIVMIQKHYGHLTASQGATALQVLAR